MRRINRYIRKCLSLVAVLTLTSCIEEKMGDCPGEVSAPKENWITLQFYLSGDTSVTRANPIGGEDGNGREDGIFNEARIHDVNIFLFADNDKLLNAASNMSLTHLYFNLDDAGDPQNTLAFEKEESKDESNKVVYTVKFLDEVPGIVLPLRTKGTVRFITVANRGRTMKGEITTLKDLWEYDSLSATWSGSDQDVSGGYDRFVMTTAYDSPATDSYIAFTDESGAGTESNPFTGKTTLERMCARIDVMYSGDNLKAESDFSELKYAVAGTVNTVHILNMLPVNVMSVPSYLFKMVTNGLKTDWTEIGGHTWGGKETTDGNGVPSNYVLEPNTLNKETLSNANLKNWYGDTRTSYIKYMIKQDGNGKVGGYYHGPLISSDEVSKSYSKTAVLGYANENTQSENQFNSNYLTGISFRAVYVPENIYGGFTETLNSEGTETFQLTPADTSAAVDTIYRYSPSKESQLEKDNIYFSKGAVLKKYQSEHPEDVPEIIEFMPQKHDGKLGLVCYYNLWLRHYNDETADPQQTYPMEYAIVRNNIYRVALEFTGPGDPEPTMREPDTMQARIFVRKWNQRKENDPLQF